MPKKTDDTGTADTLTAELRDAPAPAAFQLPTDGDEQHRVIRLSEPTLRDADLPGAAGEAARAIVAKATAWLAERGVNFRTCENTGLALRCAIAAVLE